MKDFISIFIFILLFTPFLAKAEITHFEPIQMTTAQILSSRPYDNQIIVLNQSDSQTAEITYTDLCPEDLLIKGNTVNIHYVWDINYHNVRGWLYPGAFSNDKCEIREVNTDNANCQEGYVWNASVNQCLRNENSRFWTLYQRPISSIIIPDITNYYKDSLGRNIYTDRQESNLMIGSLIKGQTDPATYIIDTDGKLRWLKTEAVAERLFGANWDAYITWFNDSIIYTYQFGDAIEQ